MKNYDFFLILKTLINYEQLKRQKVIETNFKMKVN